MSSTLSIIVRLFVLFGLLVSPVGHAGAAVVLVVGDSLSAGYGLEPDDGWVALLEQRLREEGYGYRVVNASVSGETSRGGSARLPRALRVHSPQVVVIELGGNDGLRGLPVAELRTNLERMIRDSLDAGARVLLTGIRIPPNYGLEYAQAFHRVYHELAAAYDVALVPHLLEDVALERELMQDDGIHPNARAQPLILAQVWSRLEPLLSDARRETKTHSATAAGH